MLKEFAVVSARGVGGSVLFFGLMVSLVASLIMFLAGEIMHAVLFLLFGGFVGAAFSKW